MPDGSARSIVSIDDLTDSEVRKLLEAAANPSSIPVAPFACGLLFLTPSLRTRVGFATASARLGGTPIDVAEARWSADMSAAESFEDTLRTVAGMVDVVVVRTPTGLDRAAVERAGEAPVINGGDWGGEHPTQALIDLYAIEEHAGRLGDLHVGLCGDLRARTVASLLRLFARFPPRRVTLMSPPARALASVPMNYEVRTVPSFEDLDVLYMIGLAPGEGPTKVGTYERQQFALSAQRLDELPRHAVVLCPLPVIDEIAPEARTDDRIRMFQQSDRSVSVRMAVLGLCLDR